MDETDKDLRRAFEDVTLRNLKTMTAYNEATREIVSQFEAQLNRMGDVIVLQNDIIARYENQLTALQQKVFSGGTE